MRTRSLAAFGTALAAALSLTACGGATEPPVGSGPTTTIEHQYGTTEIVGTPERVVSVGFTDQDFLLALGVLPVATREFIGGFDWPNRPWAADALGGAELETIGAEELDFEAIAAVEPDLIVGVYSYLEESDYEQLAAIAPTIGPLVGSEDLSVASWQDATVAIGEALGRSDEARSVVADVEGQIADAAEANASFAGRTLALTIGLSVEAGYIAEPEDARFYLFSDLGFAPPPEVGEISPELLSALDQDVLVVMGAREDEVAGIELFTGLPVVAEGRTVYAGGFPDLLPAALGFGSPLSLPYALDLLIPALQAATDDDPATSPQVLY